MVKSKTLSRLLNIRDLTLRRSSNFFSGGTECELRAREPGANGDDACDGECDAIRDAARLSGGSSWRRRRETSDETITGAAERCKFL